MRTLQVMNRLLILETDADSNSSSTTSILLWGRLLNLFKPPAALSINQRTPPTSQGCYGNTVG